jgi:hypothetical protein
MMSEKSILAVLDHPFVVQLGGTFQGEWFGPSPPKRSAGRRSHRVL